MAVDPTVIPLGSEVYFDGEIYIAEDIGGAIKGNIIDLFYGTEQKSIDYGVQYHTVYVKEQGK
ncbi:3D domain-containing protein [Longicatena caecimuris]|uniref:3D domain-containing protein n=1 Tax=Longicatena caecimuris TaxID=1796635 RepID=UPI002E1E3AB9